MPAKTEEIWQEVVNILKQAKESGSLNYVKYISEGIKDDLNVYPYIVLEPNREDETVITVPFRKKIVFSILIGCVMQVINKEKQIIGEGDNQKGILDFVRDVKNVLNANRNLNGKALKIDFPSTIYVYETYPERMATITMNIEFECFDTER